MTQNFSYKILKQNFGNQQRLLTYIQKLVSLDNCSDLDFYLNQVIQLKTFDLKSSNSVSLDVSKKIRFMILIDIVDELVLRDSFNAIYEYCKTDNNLKMKLYDQDWFYIVKFLRDFLTHGKVQTGFFPQKEWKKPHSKYGFVITWENIEKSKMPVHPKRKRPYLKFFKDMKKFVKELEMEYTS